MNILFLRRGRCFGFLSLVVLLAGCQGTLLKFDPLETQQTYFLDGFAAISSSKGVSGAAIAANGEPHQNGARISLALEVHNAGSEPFEIDTGNISVSSPDGKNHKVFSYDDLVREERNAAIAAIFVTGLAGAVNSYNAAQASTVRTSGTYQTQIYGPSGSYSGTGHYTSTTYDPHRGQIASSVVQAQTNEQLSGIQRNSEARLAGLKGVVLKRTTVFPGRAHGGKFVFEAPGLKQGESRRYIINVVTGTETHQFQLVQSWEK